MRLTRNSMKNKHQIRDEFRSAVFHRDGNKCRVCGVRGASVKLDAHHIVDRHEMPNGGYVPENGISLCDQPGGCHEKAEAYHRGDEILPGFHPNELYVLIGSSYDRAFEASERLHD